MPEGCTHDKIHTGSGGYYFFCSDCKARWVLTGDSLGDQGDPSRVEPEDIQSVIQSSKWSRDDLEQSTERELLVHDIAHRVYEMLEQRDADSRVDV